MPRGTPRDFATFCRLLDRQAYAAALKVDVDDLDPELFAGGDHLLGKVHVVDRHLRDVDETLDAVTDLHKGTERNQFRDAAVDELADLVGVGEVLHRYVWSP